MRATLLPVFVAGIIIATSAEPHPFGSIADLAGGHRHNALAHVGLRTRLTQGEVTYRECDASAAYDLKANLQRHIR